MAQALVGIDIGQTRTKVVVFNVDGRVLGMALDCTEAKHPHPRWAERDPDERWVKTASVVRRAFDAAGKGVEIAGLGVNGHSDGLYVVDGAGRPLRSAILATDGRAERIASRLASGVRETGCWR
jgi:L-xylulokinase